MVCCTHTDAHNTYQPSGSYVCAQDVLRYLPLSSAILNYQPIGNNELSQDVLRYLTISSAFLNYQPIRN